MVNSIILSLMQSKLLAEKGKLMPDAVHQLLMLYTHSVIHAVAIE